MFLEKEGRKTRYGEPMYVRIGREEIDGQYPEFAILLRTKPTSPSFLFTPFSKDSLAISGLGV